MPHRDHAGGDLASETFRRILLIKPSSLGDVIHALPVLAGLRKRFPDAQIDWLIGSTLAPLLAGHTALNELIAFDRRRYGQAWWNPRAALDLLRFLSSLRARRYDLVVDLQGLIRTGFFGFVTRASTRIGFADAREGAPVFYTHRLPGGVGDTHAVDRNLQVGAMLAFDPGPVRFPLELANDDWSAARDLLGDCGGPVVTLAPGARWATKCWLPERFAETIDALTSLRPGLNCVLLGGPDDAERCAEIAARTKAATLNLAGRTSLRVLAAVVGLADLVICQDSATAHLATALGRPLVCITGPTNPNRTGPYERLQDVVRLDLDCAPCYLRRLAQCPHRHRCMRELGVERVLDHALCALDAAPNALDVPSRSRP